MNTRFFKPAVIFGFIGAIALFSRIIYYSAFDLSQFNFYYIRNDEDFIPKMICVFVIFALILYLLYALYRLPRDFKSENNKSFRNVISACEYLLISVSVATAFFTLISAHYVSEIAIAFAVTAAIASICLLFHKAVKKSIDSIMSSAESGNACRIHPLLSLFFIIIFVISLSTIANCIVVLCSSSTVIVFTGLFPYLTKTSLTVFEIGVQLPIMISSLLFIFEICSFNRRCAGKIGKI